MQTRTWFLALCLALGLPLASAFGQGAYTIWVSPLGFTSDDARLTIEHGSPTTTIRVTSSEAADLQWVLLGLTIPSNVQIDSVLLYYELDNSASFISQVRLTNTTTPDVAFVRHDDGTDLTDVGPTGYASYVGGLVAEGTITLALRLNFGDPSHWIDIGGIGLVVSDVSTSIEEARDAIPEEYSLKPNYPNPFNPNTTIEYDIQRPGHVKLHIYNARGQLVRTLVDEPKSEGVHRVLWDGRDEGGQVLASGTYFYQLVVGDFVGARRMLLLK